MRKNQKVNIESRILRVNCFAPGLSSGQVSVKRGFSLIESLIAIFIFSLAAAMLAGAFSGFFKTYVSAKKSQRNVESGQYVMNLMAKTIRSSVIDPSFSPGASGATQIMMFDNSRSMCVLYKYETGVLKSAEKDDAGATITGIDNCAVALASITPSPLTRAGEISKVSFIGKPSVDGVSVGGVMISIVSSGGTASQMQTYVSLRDTVVTP